MQAAPQPDAQARTGLAGACARIADSTRFQVGILAVIVVNAVVLGLQTYEGIEDRWGGELEAANDVFLWIFVAELAIRITAFGSRPHEFFRDPWNVFDFVVVAAAFAPGLRNNATLLRLVRLARVVRLVTVMPDLRLLVGAMARSLRPIGSLVVLTGLVMYVYGMVGWVLFHEEDPENWGTIGDAMLNLFIVITLEDWPALLERGMEIHPASWIFFVSYVLIGSFLVINVLIAIIINSMEEVRASHILDDRKAGGVDDRLRELRAALDQLEEELVAGSRARRFAKAPKGRLKP